ncbi:MAG TPA: LuxR C-terminal-related transcriptional regulator [Trebonia sp.]|nr:LuxR C-terminal-related transcriptional regulator [Trebonia sp.]
MVRKLAARDDAPAEPRSAIDGAAELAKQGLAEARRAVGALRRDDQLGVDQPPELVAHFRRDLHLTVDYSVAGTPRPVAADLGIALYRVTGEALTNVARHAEGASTRVELSFDQARVRLAVTDSGGSQGPLAPEGSGWGLAGLRVVIADDQRVVREGLVVLVGLCDGIEVVGSAPDGAVAVAPVDELAPDVVLTTYADDESIFPALRAGAVGYLTKDASAEEIEAAIRAVHRGQTWLDPKVQARLVSALGDVGPAEPPRPTAGLPGNLTPREVEVLALIGEGLSNREIGERLVLSQATVKTHVNRIFAKIGTQSRAQAVRYAIGNGLAGPGNGASGW